MSTALSNNIAPLWVWIVVIAVGSILVILFLFFLVCCRIRRRRKQSHFDVEASTVPTRAVSWHGGRVVPNHSNVSLAGTIERRFDAIQNAQVTAYPGWNVKSDERVIIYHNELSPETPSANSIYTIPNAIRLDIPHSKAPRLSLGSFDDKESLSNFSNASDTSVTINGASSIIITEPQKAKAINFSRPQIRISAPPPPPKKNRLSVINESTPRNSFISRIVSWASSAHETETKKPEMQQAQPSSTLPCEHDTIPSRTDPKSTIDHLNEATADLKELIAIQTPELPSRHPMRTNSPSNDSTLSVRSKSSSFGNITGKIGHRRSNSSATNISRMGVQHTPSRSNSIADNQRVPSAGPDHRRASSNTSWIEEPQATLNGPFDAPVALIRQPSEAGSSWSRDSDNTLAAYHQATASIQSSLSNTRGLQHNITTADVVSSDRGHLRSSSSMFEAGMHGYIGRAASEQSFHHSRHQSWSQKRSPSRTSSKNGRRVLRKRSLQTPQVTLIGPVDPSALENLSVADFECAQCF